VSQVARRPSLPARFGGSPPMAGDLSHRNCLPVGLPSGCPPQRKSSCASCRGPLPLVLAVANKTRVLIKSFARRECGVPVFDPARRTRRRDYVAWGCPPLALVLGRAGGPGMPGIPRKQHRKPARQQALVNEKGWLDGVFAAVVAADELFAVADSELGEHPVQVAFHSPEGESEAERDVPVA